MKMIKMSTSFLILLFMQFVASILYSVDAQARYKFVIQDSRYTRLCKSKNILTVNGQFPGPTLYVQKGETIIVDVINNGPYNLTIHWHGVKQPRNPWSDGPELVTQCPIQPGQSFSQKVIFSTEEGTLWYHAHSAWTRATVHGAIIVKPPAGISYPFPKPYEEVPVIIGNWWHSDIMEFFERYVETRKIPPISDAFLINSQPGVFFECSKEDIFKLNVEQGKTYMLRIVNAAIENIVFFAIYKHNLTVVGTDGCYTKPYETEYIAIAPGQTIDALLDANQNPKQYYMASRAYDGAYPFIPLNLKTTTAILQYNGSHDHNQLSILDLPDLPSYGNVTAATKFASSLRSLADENHPVNVPLIVDKNMLMTQSINLGKCVNNSCAGKGGIGFGASISNISYVQPTIDILRAYYNQINGIYNPEFPDNPEYTFDFTSKSLSLSLWKPKLATMVKVLDYNTNVELVLQATSLVSASDHPIHLHGSSFYVVGWGFGNFDKEEDPLSYNLIDPPHQSTVVVPKDGWVAIRFTANNPGVWFMHCHLDLHSSWGMDMAFIVKEGELPNEKMLPPPEDMPPC